MMSRQSEAHFAHPKALSAEKQANTRTYPPIRRDGWWWGHTRNRSFVLFGVASIPVVAESYILLWAVVSIASGAATWEDYVEWMRSPPVRLFHVLALPLFLWYGGRFLRLFPKTQPPRVELSVLPERWRNRPPLGLLARTLFLTWGLGMLGALLLLGGWLP